MCYHCNLLVVSNVPNDSGSFRKTFQYSLYVLGDCANALVSLKFGIIQYLYTHVHAYTSFLKQYIYNENSFNLIFKIFFYFKVKIIISNLQSNVIYL